MTMDAEQRIYSADEARALREAAEEFVELPLRADTFRGAVVVSDDTDFGKVASVEVGDKGMNTAVAMIFAAAPDLAASVEHHAARADAASQERDALRAIIDGRTVPPTDTEMAQHDSRGGSWLIAPRHYQPVAYRDISIAKHYALMALDGDDALPMTWWALDATGRPCAWPVVAGRAAHGAT